MNDETASFIEGLHLDQTVPANLAAVAAAAAAAAAANMVKSSKTKIKIIIHINITFESNSIILKQLDTNNPVAANLCFL